MDKIRNGNNPVDGQDQKQESPVDGQDQKQESPVNGQDQNQESRIDGQDQKQESPVDGQTQKQESSVEFESQSESGFPCQNIRITIRISEIRTESEFQIKKLNIRIRILVAELQSNIVLFSERFKFWQKMFKSNFFDFEFYKLGSFMIGLNLGAFTWVQSEFGPGP